MPTIEEREKEEEDGGLPAGLWASVPTRDLHDWALWANPGSKASVKFARLSRVHSELTWRPTGINSLEGRAPFLTGTGTTVSAGIGSRGSTRGLLSIPPSWSAAPPLPPPQEPTKMSADLDDSGDLAQALQAHARGGDGTHEGSSSTRSNGAHSHTPGAPLRLGSNNSTNTPGMEYEDPVAPTTARNASKGMWGADDVAGLMGGRARARTEAAGNVPSPNSAAKDLSVMANFMKPHKHDLQLPPNFGGREGPTGLLLRWSAVIRAGLVSTSGQLSRKGGWSGGGELPYWVRTLSVLAPSQPSHAVPHGFPRNRIASRGVDTVVQADGDERIAAAEATVLSAGRAAMTAAGHAAVLLSRTAEHAAPPEML